MRAGATPPTRITTSASPTAAQAWLEERAGETAGKPWVLFVSLVCPHFPLIARDEWYDLYPEDKVPWPQMYAEAERPTHPYVKAIRESMIYDQGFDESKVRKAIAAYFGMVSYVDHNVGRLIETLEDTGLADTTRIVYTSDHGDNLGSRGLWGKSTMYEESVGVPMMMAGPEVPSGVVCREPVSLVDSFATILDCVGLPRHPDDRDLPGAPLMDVVAGRAAPRTVMSEYHAAGAAAAAFMIRLGSFKYVHYVGMPPQLFNLATDPRETRDLARTPAIAASSPRPRRHCARWSIPRRRIARPAPTRRPKSRSSAGARQSLPAAPSAIRRCPAPSPCLRRDGLQALLSDRLFSARH